MLRRENEVGNDRHIHFTSSALLSRVVPGDKFDIVNCPQLTSEQQTLVPWVSANSRVCSRPYQYFDTGYIMVAYYTDSDGKPYYIYQTISHDAKYINMDNGKIKFYSIHLQFEEDIFSEGWACSQPADTLNASLMHVRDQTQKSAIPLAGDLMPLGCDPAYEVDMRAGLSFNMRSITEDERDRLLKVSGLNLHGVFRMTIDTFEFHYTLDGRPQILRYTINKCDSAYSLKQILVNGEFKFFNLATDEFTSEPGPDCVGWLNQPPVATRPTHAQTFDIASSHHNDPNLARLGFPFAFLNAEVDFRKVYEDDINIDVGLDGGRVMFVGLHDWTEKQILDDPVTHIKFVRVEGLTFTTTIL